MLSGSILRQGTTIKGLTTAASLWFTTAIGLAAGTWFCARLTLYYSHTLQCYNRLWASARSTVIWIEDVFCCLFALADEYR
jgi:uncharacterized membrane protein YhiD involved in acid resistance